MPLLEIPGTEAVSTRKENPYGAWGDRLGANRVEPIALPSFHVPFKLQPGEKIFTVGSCFARNVEVELLRRGFKLPMRDIFKKEEFAKIGLGAINNFGMPSIYNEFAWAFGEQPFVEDDHILEVQGGKYIDMHVIHSVRPDSREVVLERRRAITEAYRTASECRVIVMTLGLVELWYDTKTGYYLNTQPRPTQLRNEPERFTLRVLSFETANAYMERTLDLLRRYGHPDVKLILTVSPVPLMATLRPDDVIVANSYSKSLLRTVAETAVMKHDFVTYFPSYESVMLSDRRRAWTDDFVHVTEEIVAINVGRMVDAYMDSGFDIEALRRSIQAGGLSAAIETARNVNSLSSDEAHQFFEEFKEFSRESEDFAVAHATFLSGRKKHEEALEILQAAPQGSDMVALNTAEVLLALGRGPEAYDRLSELALAGRKSFAVWKLFLRIAQSTGDEERVRSVVSAWARVVPSRAGYANTLAGRWFMERGDVASARNHLERAIGLDPEDAMARMYLVELLLNTGEPAEAAALVTTIQPRTPNEEVLLERLVKSMPASSASSVAAQ